jgi:hypothetical protein
VASVDVIRRLLDAGANYETIGQAVGRNRSLIRQVGIGAKPGANLEQALLELENRLAGVPRTRVNTEGRRAAGTLTPAPERTNARGKLAKVRRPSTVRGESWSTSTSRRQAVRSGARGLAHPLADAADAGANVGVTVTVDGRAGIEVHGSGGASRKGGTAGRGGSAEFQIHDPDGAFQTIMARGGDVVAYLAQDMLDRGLVSGTSSASELAAHITEVQLRTW